MKTKQEIISGKLSQAMEYVGSSWVLGQTEAGQAMDEWAKQVALSLSAHLSFNYTLVESTRLPVYTRNLEHNGEHSDRRYTDEYILMEFLHSGIWDGEKHKTTV